MGLLSRVESKPPLRPPRIVIYGKGGVGKTTFAASIPHVLVLPAEEGEGKLQFARLPKPDTYEDVVNGIIELLREQHEWKAYAIDTIDHIEPLVWKKVCEDRSDGKKAYASIEDFGYQKGYIYADEYWAKMLRGMDALRRDRGMVTVALAHTETRTAEDPIHGSYDEIRTKLHKRANALLHEWADIVGYLEIERTVTERGEGSRKTRHSVTTGRRLLHLIDRGGFFAKNRYSLPSPLELPEVGGYAKLRDAIKQSIAATKSVESEGPAAPVEEGATNGANGAEEAGDAAA